MITLIVLALLAVLAVVLVMIVEFVIVIGAGAFFILLPVIIIVSLLYLTIACIFGKPKNKKE